MKQHAECMIYEKWIAHFPGTVSHWMRVSLTYVYPFFTSFVLNSMQKQKKRMRIWVHVGFSCPSIHSYVISEKKRQRMVLWAAFFIAHEIETMICCLFYYSEIIKMNNNRKNIVRHKCSVCSHMVINCRSHCRQNK